MQKTNILQYFFPCTLTIQSVWACCQQCLSKVKNDQFKTLCKDEERGIKVQNILTFSRFAAPSVRQRLTHCLSAQQNADCAKTE